MRRLLAALLLLSTSAQAQDHITVDGLLNDEDFYRLVACAAPPQGSCQKPLVRWQLQRPLRLYIAPFPRAFMGSKGPRAIAGVTIAIKEINAAQAGIKLARTRDRNAADIQLFLIDAKRGETINGTGLHWVDGSPLGGATTRLRIEAAKGRIIDGAIAISKDLRITSYESVILEELTQALGLMTDIDSPAYVGVSVFSQKGNDVKALSIQDKRALRRHYAAK